MNYSDTPGNDEERTVGPKGPSKSDPAQYKNGARAATTNRRGHSTTRALCTPLPRYRLPAGCSPAVRSPHQILRCPAPTMPPPPPSAPASHHLRLWWRRRGRAGAVGATFAVALLAAALLLALSSYASIVFPASSGRRGPALVGLTLVRRASEKGAREFPAHNTSLLSILNFKFRTAVRPFVLAHVRCPEYFPTRNRPRDLSRVSALVFAVCLDGSAPGYHLQGGSGSGSRSWLIHLEVGDVPDRYHVSIRARAPWVSKLV